jgi:hypothetical protein
MTALPLRAISDTSSRVFPVRTSAVEMPMHVTVCIWAMIATSSVVMFEPAPCDLAFILSWPLLLLTGHITLVRPFNPLLYFGAITFLILNAISLTMARELFVGLRYFAITLYLAFYAALFVSLVGRYGDRAIRAIYYSLQVAAALTAVIGLLAQLRLIPHWEMFMLSEVGLRVKGTFKDANVYGPFLVAAMVMILTDIIVTKRIKIWQVICLSLQASGILLSFSRGAFLAAFVSVVATFALCYWLPAYRNSTKRVLLMMVPVFLLVSAIMFVLLVSTDLMDYFLARFGYQSYDDIRFLNQQDILNTVGRVPVGIGPGQWNFDWYLHDVHSLFLRTWVEHGLLALIGLLCLITAWLADAWKGLCRSGPNTHYLVACVAIVLGILSNSASIDTVHWRHFVLFAAVGTGIIVHDINHKKARNVSETDSIT